MVLYDAVPGGAGHVGRIEAVLEEVLRKALIKVSDCECGPETSCYRCLRVFRNERFHDDLSRGAARDLLSRLLGSTLPSADISRYDLADLPLQGQPGERFLIEQTPWEVFQRAEPGQLDLYAGRTCIAAGRRTGRRVILAQRGRVFPQGSGRRNRLGSTRGLGPDRRLSLKPASGA
ncbi:MAG: box helicase [Frankiales bacterium]|nr:box helicase [Frankiales bacterium]